MLKYPVAPEIKLIEVRIVIRKLGGGADLLTFIIIIRKEGEIRKKLKGIS